MYKQRQKSRKKINLGPTVIYDKSLKLDEYLEDKTRINLMANRSCYFSPDTKDFGQFTESSGSAGHKIGAPRCPEMDDSMKNVNEMCVPCDTHSGGGSPEASSGVAGRRLRASTLLHGVCAQSGSNSSFVRENVVKQAIEEKYSNDNISIKDVRICNEPRIKIVAEKFSRYKRQDVEIRKLEGRLVCVEYDVFARGAREGAGPVQALRAYFAVAPAPSTGFEKPLNVAPGRSNEDAFRNKEMGIEIIDANIPQNKVYLEDLKRFLKRKQTNRDKREHSPLNPTYLYNMAKKDVYSDISFTDLISKAEMDQIKDFIMKKTASSVYGINRRNLRPEKYSKNDTGEDIIIEQILKFM